jgi:hypothetical protein
MWQALGWAAWAVSGAIFVWMAWDFFRINGAYGEDVLLSSREGVDELFAESANSKGK